MNCASLTYIVESLAGYRAAQSAGAPANSLWLSTSPAIIEHLTFAGKNIRSLEQTVEQEQIEALAQAGYDFTFPLLDHLNEICFWREYLDLKLMLAFGVNNCFFPIFYKAMLIQKAMRADSTSRFFCVGNPESDNNQGLQLLWGRLDNLFSVLAAHTPGLENLGLLRHQDDPMAVAEQIAYAKKRDLEPWEKLLSVLANRPGSFCAKLFKNIWQRKLYPFRHVSLIPWDKGKFVYIYHDCELIDEIFLGLLRRGVHIGRLGPLPICPGNHRIEMPDDKPLKEYIFNLCLRSVRQRGFEVHPLFETAGHIVADRILAVLSRLKAGLTALTHGFEQVCARMEPGSMVFTNALTSPEERAFYCFCRKKKIKIVAFEHGLVYGLSEWDDRCARHAGMLAADRGVYHTDVAVETIAPYAQGQEMIVVGLPLVTARMVWPYLQRFLSRRWLGLGMREHVVFCLAPLERNNYIYGPYMENDWPQHNWITAMVHVLRKSYPTSRIVLKLYPSSRYVDRYEYENLAAMENVVVIRDMDFRFIRAAADVVFLESAQSTLGWCLGSGAPVIFTETDQAPMRFCGAEVEFPGIAGVRRVTRVSMEQVAKPAEYNDDFFKKILS